MSENPVETIKQKIAGHDWEVSGRQFVEVAKFGFNKITLELSDLYSKVRDVRMQVEFDRALNEVNENIKMRIGKEIHPEYFKNEEYLRAIFYTYTEAVQVRNIDKVHYFKSALISGLLRHDIDSDKKILFVSCLSGLSLPAIDTLAKIRRHLDKEKRRTSFNVGDFVGIVGISDIELLVAQLMEIGRFNLIHIQMAGIGTSKQENGSVFINNLLIEFCTYITEYVPPKPITQNA